MSAKVYSRHRDDEKAEKLFRSIRFTLESENKTQKNNKRPKVNTHLSTICVCVLSVYYNDRTV